MRPWQRPVKAGIRVTCTCTAFQSLGSIQQRGYGIMGFSGFMVRWPPFSTQRALAPVAFIHDGGSPRYLAMVKMHCTRRVHSGELWPRGAVLCCAGGRLGGWGYPRRVPVGTSHMDAVGREPWALSISSELFGPIILSPKPDVRQRLRLEPTLLQPDDRRLRSSDGIDERDEVCLKIPSLPLGASWACCLLSVRPGWRDSGRQEHTTTAAFSNSGASSPRCRWIDSLLVASLTLSLNPEPFTRHQVWAAVETHPTAITMRCTLYLRNPVWGVYTSLSSLGSTTLSRKKGKRKKEPRGDGPNRLSANTPWDK